MARTKSSKSSLRLYTETPPALRRSPTLAIGSLPEVLRSFRQATGWSLEYLPDVASRAASKSATEARWSAPINSGVGTTPGQIVLGPVDSETPPPLPLEQARMLASSLGGMLEELVTVRQSLYEREAELAAGVPLVPHAAEEKHLAHRLEAVLRGGAEAVGCDAAALYLLDEATSKLKLRSCWGLPLDRLTAPARPLQGAVADLESLLGHAVVIEDSTLLRHWNAPENFPSAACVPVSTSTTILGTLWIFSNTKRDFNERETNIVEVVAGRLAAELEREMLWNEGTTAVTLKKQVVAAERLQRSQLPGVAPLLQGWEVAGWTAQAGPLGGDFHDWFCLPDGLVAVAAGHAMEQGVSAALAATGLKAALRAHGQYYREAQQTIKRLNLTLWTGSAGDQRASLFYGLIETTTGRVCSASAGGPGLILVRRGGWESLSHASAKLGEGPESIYEQQGFEMQPGEVLIAITDGMRDALGQDGQPLGEACFAQWIQAHLDLSASDLVALVRGRWEESIRSREVVRDRTILVVKRRNV